MSSSLSAKDIFGRDYFASYSEFYLALAIGKVLGLRGLSLDMDGMLVDADSVPQDMILYYKKLLYDGCITMSMYEKKGVAPDVASTDIDISYFNDIELTEEKDGCLYWSLDVARDKYGVHSGKFLDLLSLGYTLIHLIAYHLVNSILDGDKRKLIIQFDSFRAKSTFIYVNIYSILQTLEWVKGLVELDVDFGDYEVDLDYSIFCSNARVAGRYRLHSISEKLDIMGRYGMVEGSILILWERDGMCENNEYGHITGAKLFRLDEVGDTFLGVTFLGLNKTKEEVRQDYYEIDESIRYLFVDMLDKPPYIQSTEIDLFGTGIDNYFFNEEQYITLLDESEKVFKTVTINDEVVRMEMSGIDAIYWLLCQYNIEFDKSLFRKMYFGLDTTPLWDMYN